jgi:hypothetical protein
MMDECIKCHADDGRPVYRTAPLGETPANWTCEECLENPPPKDVKEIVNIIDDHRRSSTPQIREVDDGNGNKIRMRET